MLSKIWKTLNIKVLFTCFLSLFIASERSTLAEAYQYQRLILQSPTGEVIRTIDLIYDYHRRSEEHVRPLSKASRIRKQLTSEDPVIMTPSEAALFVKLKQVTGPEKNQGTTLVWEDHERPTSRNDIFIISAGNALKRMRQDHFVSADLLRNKFRDLQDLRLDRFLEALKESRKVIKSFLDQSEKTLGQTEHQLLKKAFSEYESEELALLNQIHQNQQKVQEGTMYEWEQDILKRELHDKVASLEMLLKAFSSKSKHSIVYAGGSHCSDISKWMNRSGIATEAVHVGAEDKIPSSAPEWYLRSRAELDPSLWNFLSEDPDESLTRLKKRGKIQKVLDPEYWMRYRNFSHPLEIAQLVQEANQAHIDIVNAIDERDENRTLLHKAAIRNWPGAVKELIKRGANPLMKDKNGKRAIDYATELHHTEIAEFLSGSPGVKNENSLSDLPFSSSELLKALAPLEECPGLAPNAI